MENENKDNLIYNPYEGFIINDEFLKTRPLSQSSLKQFKKSPKHYIQYLMQPRKDAEVLTVGSLIDCLALTPEDYEKTFRVYEKFDKRSNADKLKWQELCDSASKDKVQLITKQQYDEAKIVVDALYSYNDARELLEAKKNAQAKINWKDKATGLPIVAKIDFECEIGKSHYLVDLKTTGSGQPDDFNRDIFKYGHNLQAACYLLAYQKKFFKFPEFLNLVVEKEPPYNVTIMYYDAKAIEQAKDEFYGLLKAFRRCMDENKWSMGYEFWLFGMHKYFTVNQPGYYKHHGIGTED
jgi:hypothetical protein